MRDRPGRYDAQVMWGPCGLLIPARPAKPWDAIREDETWMSDRPPAGTWLSSDSAGGWQWATDNPPPFAADGSTRSSHVSPATPGLHRHGFGQSRRRLQLHAGVRLFAYVHLPLHDAARAVVLQWSIGDDASHRAAWGPDGLVEGTTALRVGDLPPAGQ